MDLLGLMMATIKTLSMSQSASNNKDARTILFNCKDWVDVLRKLATLQNSYNPPEMRNMALGEFFESSLAVYPSFLLKN